MVTPHTRGWIRWTAIFPIRISCAMTKNASSEHTVVVASYSSRGDAEIARDRLDEAGIAAFVRADDAGGMYPQLQWSNGVHLAVLDRERDRAHRILHEADMLPRSVKREPDEAEDPLAEATAWSGIRALLLVFAVIAAIMILGIWWQFGSF